MSRHSLRFIVQLLFLVVVVSIVFVLAVCSGNTASVTTAQATSAAQTVAGSVILLMAHQNAWTPPPSAWTSGSHAVSYSTAGLSMAGTVTVSSPNTTYNMTLTLSNYMDAATSYTVNGTVNWSQTGTSTSQSGTVTGNLSLSGGPVTDATWNTSFTSSGGPPTFTGTITCNGTSFDANTLLAGTVQAQTAMQAVVNVLATVLGKQSGWTPSSDTWTSGNTYTVSYSDTGVSMTAGTVTVSGTIYTYVVPITLSNYVAGATGYSVSGTVTWSVVEDNSTNPATYTSGTVTVGLTLSGGTVTTETWNLSNVSGITTAPMFSGIITINGTSFDAKII